jgi:DNA-binding transcriptional LysR family regulator
MVRDELSLMAAFLAVAEERSFTPAAKRLEVSPSALSHAIRRLEEQLGVRLLSRTTRSVAPTAAGEELLTSLRPALGEIRGALVRALADWCPPFPGFILYYPSRRQQPAALTALIEALRLHGCDAPSETAR